MINNVLDLFRNWRIDVLFVLCIIQVVLTFASSEDIPTLFTIKLFAYIVGYIIYRLFKYWDARGKLTELAQFTEEE